MKVLGSTAKREYELIDQVTDVLGEVLHTLLGFTEQGHQPSYLLREVLILPSSGLSMTKFEV